MKGMFYEINYNRNLTYTVVDLRRDLPWVSLLAAEMQCIIDILSLSRQPTTTEIPTLPISHRMVQERIFMSTTQPSLRGQRPESKRFPWAEQIYDDCFILFFSHYSVPTLNTSWLHLFDLIGKIPSNLENILNRIVSETLILISIYVKGNSLSHVMEQSRGDPASDKSYFRRFKCHILD